MKNNEMKQEVMTVKKQRILELINAILSNKYIKLTDLSASVNISIPTIEKYLFDKQLMSDFMNSEEYINVLNIYEKLKNKKFINEEDLELEKFELVSGIVNDILNTRFKLEDIRRRHYISEVTFKRLFSDENYLKKNFGENIVEILNDKIRQNALLRRKVIDNKIVIEEENDLRVLKEDIVSLSYADYRRLKIVSKYLLSGANIEYVMRELDLPFKTVLETLAASQNKNIIKDEMYVELQRLAKMERILAESIGEKQQLIIACASKLKETNYNVFNASQQLNIPYYLLKRILTDDYAYFVFEQSVMNKITNCFNEDESKKIK